MVINHNGQYIYVSFLAEEWDEVKALLQGLRKDHAWPRESEDYTMRTKYFHLIYDTKNAAADAAKWLEKNKDG